jgi:NTP pyrophosphatase (non-canonical NTP hydrolase)
MTDLVKQIEKWGELRGLNTADPNRQFLKLAEEIGELAAAMARNNKDAER